MAADPAPLERHRPSEALVVAVALVFATMWACQAGGSNDEYIVLSDARRVLAGQVMYRDFFQFTPPLPAWLMAAALAAFGPKVAVMRGLLYLGLVFASWGIHRITRRLGADPWTATLPAIALFPVAASLNHGVNHHWFALTFLIASVWVAVDAAPAARRRWALAGALAGLAMGCVQVEGLVALTALLGYVGLAAWLTGEAWRPALRRLGWVLAGWAVPVGVLFAVLAAQGALGAYFYDVWYWPPTHYRQPGNFNDLRYLTDMADFIGPMKDVPNGRALYYAGAYRYLFSALVPVVAALVALLWGLGQLGRRLTAGPDPAARPEALRAGYVGLLAIAGMVMAFKGRTDISHLAAYSVPAMIMAGAAASWARRLAPPAWALVAALPTLAIALSISTSLARSLPPAPQAWGLDAADWPAGHDPTIAWLRAHARPGDTHISVTGTGYYAFYTIPLGAHLTSILRKIDNYYDEAQVEGFWADVRSGRARFLIADMDPWIASHSDWTGPPPGYRRAALYPSFRYPRGWVEIYERVGPPPASPAP